MDTQIRTNHGLVKRNYAEGYLLMMLIAFGASVMGTRLFLELTGYPQLGGGTFHFAHLLWGGLLLFAGALLPLIFVNRVMYTISAIMTGLGVGLFIDEVGKFITATNDYFFPLAAPIIYVFFVGTVILYLIVRGRREQGPRTALYAVLDHLSDVIDHDLDSRERQHMMGWLNATLNNRSATDDMRVLAMHLLEVMNDPALDIYPRRESWWERLGAALVKFEQRYLRRTLMRFLTGILLIIFSISSLLALTVTVLALIDPATRDSFLAGALLDADPRFSGPYALLWEMVLIALQGLIGLIAMLSGISILLGRDDIGTRVAFVALIINLTTVNLLTFYYEQFAAVLATIFQVALILVLMRYRQRFILKTKTTEVLSKLVTQPVMPEINASGG
ncbi:MAG: hypothetical protein UZ15_CFX003000916 [Chloroflexi bacterium OLB15]|nr:MAG: hypothetical protein UZ15_CFX003000916 [Chloroflexi bacterium OLB15]